MAAAASTPIKRGSEEQEAALHPSDQSERTSQDVAPPNQGEQPSQQQDGPDGLSSMQKRRRVTRACDECRKKKIRCDGRQPCTHCTVYSYECSYDQPSNRRRNAPPVFLEAMEKKLFRAQAILQLCFPGVKLDDTRFDVLLKHDTAIVPGDISSISATFNSLEAIPQPTSGPSEPGSDLESMVTSQGALDQNEKGEYDYFGASSGFNFMRRMSEEFGELVSSKGDARRFRPSHPNQSAPDPQRMSSAMMTIPGAMAGHGSPLEHDNSIDDLPSRDSAHRLVRFALDDACAILPLVHQPSFFASFNRIYTISPEEYNTQDQRFLPLLYVVVALGCLFAKDSDSELERKGYLSATDQGYKYFWAARQLMDVTDCRDLISLQAVIFMILFLQCSAKLATCYAFIGVALRSATRMGLHRSVSGNFNPVELELRKRCFWIIRKMDTFVGAMLGLPLTLSDDEIDQEFPAEVDDENVTPDGIKPQDPNEIPLIAATNQDFRLTLIVQKIVHRIYPIKAFKSSTQAKPRVQRVRLSVIKEIERDLQAWEDQLHPIFKPGHDAPPKYRKIRNLLRMAFAHVQLLLYRPFLHYLSARSHKMAVERSSQACAAACVHVSRNIIHITASMNQNVLSLVFYALENEAVSQEIMRDAVMGRQTLAAVAQRSMAADRCTAALTILFDQIATKFEQNVSPPQQVVSSTDRSQAQPMPQNVAEQRAMLSATTQATTQLPSSSVDGSSQMPAEPYSASQPFHLESKYLPTTAPTGLPQRFPIQGHFQTHPSHDSPSLQNLPLTGSGPPSQHPAFEGSQFSHLIFPSSDPFAYPNQPMLSLDQSQGLGERQHAMPSADPFVSVSIPANPSMHANDLADAHMSGVSAYAPHGMQQQHHHQPNHQPHQPHHPQFMPDGSMQHDNEQAMIGDAGVQFPGLDFGDFFGSGDWSQRIGR